MKISIPFCKLCLIAISVLCTNMAFSANPEKPVSKLKIKENSYEKLVLINSLEVQDIRTLKINTAKGLFSELVIPEYGSSNVIGSPRLPVLKKLIEVPVNATVKIEIKNSTYTDIKLSELGGLYPVMPAQPSVSKSDDPKNIVFQYNKSVYKLNQFIQHDLVTFAPVGTMRGTNLGRIEIAPFLYNPIKKTLRIYTNIEVEIVFENADVTATIEQKATYYSPYFVPSLAKIFNYKSLPVKSNFTKYPVKYVIVADTMFHDLLQPFVEWKTKKGFTVVQAYTSNVAVGNTTTSIKTYLQNLYNNGTVSDPAPSFVLFVGDIAQVPAFTGTTGSHVTDLYYCEYTGDFLPEVYYGRFSATNISELRPQIDKTLEYEKYLMPQTSFLDTCVMIAGQDGTFGPTHGDGQINYGTDTYFNALHGLYSNTYPYAISGSSASQIIQNVSDGVCMATYTAHGGSSGWSNPGFSVADVNNLTNVHKYPLLIGNCCLTNKFDDPCCFGEALLRADSKGALGYIGGSNSTYWDEDYYWGVGYRNFGSGNPPLHATFDAANPGAYDGTFHDHGELFGGWYVTQGQMISAGNLAVTQSGSTLNSYYWEIYHLMGDPSLMVYYSEPPAMSVTYNALMPLGVTTFDITTDAPYAYAAISKAGILYGAALADSLGNITVNLDPITVPGVADIVITRQNRQPYIGTVVIASPSGPYVLYTKNHVNTSSNSDTIVDYNENVILDATLKNFGGAVALGVNAIISSSDPYVSISDNSGTWGSINSNSLSTQTAVFAFTTPGYVPDQHVAPFSMTITDNNSNTWNSVFNLKINAPELNIGSFSINDSLGNNNQVIDPSENLKIIIQSSNTGHSDATGTTGTLTTNSPFITITDTVFNFNSLNKGTAANAVFDISVSSLLPDTAVIEFIYTVKSGDYFKTNYYYITVGEAMEDFETGDFTKFEWQSGGNVPWSITNIAPYEGVFSAKSGTITHGQSSELFVTMQITVPDTISFWKKVSCEQGSNYSGSYYWYDYLEFLIDGVTVERWDGENPDFSKSFYPVTSGIHTFKWVYSKDGSVSGGQDCAWLDYIVFPPSIKVINAINENKENNADFNFYPNPANSFTNINFTISEPSNISLKMYDMNGRLVDAILEKNFKQQGTYNILVNTGKYQSGIYTFEFISDIEKITKKIIIIK